jgi:hypothetical protein
METKKTPTTLERAATGLPCCLAVRNPDKDITNAVLTITVGFLISAVLFYWAVAP